MIPDVSLQEAENLLQKWGEYNLSNFLKTNKTNKAITKDNILVTLIKDLSRGNMKGPTDLREDTCMRAATMKMRTLKIMSQ